MEIYDEVFEKAKLLWRGELSLKEEAVLREMSAAACLELLGRLKEGVSASEIREQLVRAAASLAVSMFIELDVGGLDSYSAGGLSVKRRDIKFSQEAARSLRKQAELMLIGYLRERGFDFKAVRG